MPTVAEILRQTGISEDDIQKLDSKLTDGFQSILNQADAANTEAKEVERRYQHMYSTEIVPALNQWGSEKATLTAERDFYRAQNEGARTAGFLPKDAPGYGPAPSAAGEPVRGADGRYVAGGNPVPGSPGPSGVDMNRLVQEIREGVGNSQWAMNEYQRLYGQPLPEDYDFNTAWNEAVRNRMEFKDYFAQKYKFAEKRREETERRQREHDDAIRKETTDKINKEWAERTGSNPLLRPASQSQFATVRKAMDSGRAKDPLTLNTEQRRVQTNERIHADIAERTSQGNA